MTFRFPISLNLLIAKGIPTITLEAKEYCEANIFKEVFTSKNPCGRSDNQQPAKYLIKNRINKLDK